MSAVISVKSGGRWVTPGRIPVDPPVDPPSGQPARFTDSNKPWTLQAGESLLDDIPAGVPIVNASTYSSSTDLYTVLQAVGGGVSGPCYVRLDGAPRYFINSMIESSTNSWLGFHNGLTPGGRKIMGLIGLGVEQTSIKVQPTMISSTPNARDYALAMTKAQGPAPYSALYFSNSNVSAPMFFSGISFDGTLQTPYGVYNTTVQGQFTQNQAVASPLPWAGLAMWRALAGSRVQYCRFRGFGYALLNAPPFEKGLHDTNYSDGLLIYRCEDDGRIAAEFDATRHRAAGGLMWNKDIRVTVRDSWLHHTRRSGWAMNTNTGRTDELYTGENIQLHDITGTDEFAANTSGFPASNIEGLVGRFVYRNWYASISTSAPHIYYALPFSGSPGNYTVPDRPLIYSTGFWTDDTKYNGCLRIEISKQPNSTGISPAWTKISNLGIAGSNLMDIRAADGTPLIGVKSTSFDGSKHKPSTHFVVIY